MISLADAADKCVVAQALGGEEADRPLVEGFSIRSTARIVGVFRNTVDKLLLDLAEVCQRYSDEHLRDLPCRRLHDIDHGAGLDEHEIWSFVYAKAKYVPEKREGEFGSATSAS